VLPLIDTSANNALVEAMSCGTVPVVNEVGGVSDYGGGQVFPMAANAEAMLELMAGYLNDPARIAQCAKACRAFALEKLDWRIIREQHLKLYQQVAEEAKAS